MAAETVTVNLGGDGGEVRYRASGFIHNFRWTDDSLIVPLKIQLHRTFPSATWSQAERMKALGIQQQAEMGGAWAEGSWGGDANAYPGDNGNWAPWEQCVVNTVQEAQSRGLKPQWDIWNEPDTAFWPRSPEQFNEAWRRAVLKIREIDPTATIVGPSWADVHPGEARFADFLRYSQENGVIPNYVSWHFPRDTVKEAKAARTVLANLGVPEVGIIINEYTFSHEQYSGKTAWLIAQLDRAKVDFASHAIWGGSTYYDLDGIIFTSANGDTAPKGQWWAYQRYAAITGRIVTTAPSINIDLVAGQDEGTKTVSMLLGSSGQTTGNLGNVTVRIQDIDALPYLLEGGRVHVVVEKIPEASGGEVTSLPLILDTYIPVINNAFDVTIPWSSDRDAYAVRLGTMIPEPSTIVLVTIGLIGLAGRRLYGWRKRKQ